MNQKQTYERYSEGFEKIWHEEPMTKEQWEAKQNEEIPQNCTTCGYYERWRLVFEECTHSSGGRGCLGAFGRKYWKLNDEWHSYTIRYKNKLRFKDK